MASYVSRTPAASSRGAVEHFSGRLSFETDCCDVHHAIENDKTDFVLLNLRSEELYRIGHLPTATSLPHWKINESTWGPCPVGTSFVTYCAGPQCGGADKGALAIVKLGRPVKLMIGDAIGWLDEGFDLVGSEADTAKTT